MSLFDVLSPLIESLGLILFGIVLTAVILFLLRLYIGIKEHYSRKKSLKPLKNR